MNRKIKVTLLLFAFSTTLFAQKMKVANAITYHEAGDLQNAYSSIMEALNPDDPKAVKKTLNWSGTWEEKGSILYDVYKMGIRNIVYEPILESYAAYKKAMELDIKNRRLKDIKESLKKMQPDLAEMANKAYKLGRFSIALDGYQKYLEIANMPLLKDEKPSLIDTTVYYNAGLAAFSAKSWPEAKQFFQITAQKQTYGEDSYIYLYGVYQALSDTLKQYETLKEAFQKFPDSDNINIELVRFCITTNRPEEAVDYINAAIARAPENATLYTLKGRALEDAGNDNAAIDAYIKSIELDPELFVPTYNLAVIYFNRGAYIINNAIKLPQEDDDEYEKQVAFGISELAKGLPLFEKARELRPADEKVSESLKFIYAQIQKTAKTN